MEDDYHTIEARIQLAVEELKCQEKPNISKTARDFNVSRHRLGNRFHGRGTLYNRPPTGLKLNKEQESALCQYIDTLDKMGTAPQPKMIENCANLILKEGHDDPSTPPPKVGDKWLKRWLKRHPKYDKKRARAIELDRKRAHDHEAIQDWFERFDRVRRLHGIVNEDIWNFDETGFQIGQGKDNWVITREREKKLYIGSQLNWEYVTVVEAVSAVGEQCPPMIIMARKCVIWGWFDHAEKGCNIGVSESGYMTDSLVFQWIQLFHNATRKSKKGQYRLLICDGFGSHLTYEFVQFCEKYDIILFILPPHSSHILQPLDVGVFHTYKHWHSEAIADAIYSGCGSFTKIEFLHALKEIQRKTFKERTIQHGFRKTGLVPYNPAVVLDNLPATCVSTPDSVVSNHSHWSWGSTPKTVKRFKQVALNVRHLEGLGHDFNENLDLLVKGSIATAYHAENLKKQLEEMTATQQACMERASASRQCIQLGGVVSSENLAQITRVKKGIDEERLKSQMRSKWNLVMTELKEYAIQKGIIKSRQRRSRKTI